MDHAAEGLDSGLKQLDDLITRLQRGHENVILELDRLGKESQNVSSENFDPEAAWFLHGLFSKYRDLLEVAWKFHSDPNPKITGYRSLISQRNKARLESLKSKTNMNFERFF